MAFKAAAEIVASCAILPKRRYFARSTLLSVSHAPPIEKPRLKHSCICTNFSLKPSGGTSSRPSADLLLDSFWKARGVTEAKTRRQLVDAAQGAEQEAATYQLDSQEPLPGISATWHLQDAAASTLPQVREVSRRLLALQQLLGGREDVDVVWMVVREPQLLSADFRSIMRRLLEMRVSEGAEGVDVVRLVEAHPALLLQQGVQVCAEESAGERFQAWQHGLVSDNSVEWERRFSQLQQYMQRYGDPHVGHREDEDPELVKWAAKQRSAHSSRQLEEERTARLQALGFEFDEEHAEWLRWFNEIRAFRKAQGHATPAPLAAGSDFLLINWCSVQRIAARSGVLNQQRRKLLDSIDFDWTGADALS